MYQLAAAVWQITLKLSGLKQHLLSQSFCGSESQELGSLAQSPSWDCNQGMDHLKAWLGLEDPLLKSLTVGWCQETSVPSHKVLLT